MFLLKNTKKLRILALLFFLTPGMSHALNIFEIFLIKTGVAFVYYQYNDKSLNYESDLVKKNEVLTNFYQNKLFSIKSDQFRNLPLQQQMLVIEELHLQK
ncbi:MAG: hypothetical protein CL572_05155 [Alphaproteobacteria bacterium]|nr:hypothetical protein [Alphaproteobacteria bacterium]|tara:strand:- start:723 stop:1022 length:300 start_codon:yes stop_codon:yes gene_type:complete